MSTFFDLFTSLSGILSLFVVLFIIGMAVFCAHMFITKMNSEGEEYDRTHPKTTE